MDLLEGETLGALITRAESLSVEDTANTLLPVISAVGTAHAAGLVHRDLKPENIFLVAGAAGPRVLVLDFGIAKWTGNSTIAGETGLITATGTLLGTPCYMAPEQAFGERDVDHRADAWAVGVILYECLSGARPVEGDNLGQVLKRMMHDGITPIETLVDVPEAVAVLARRLLCRERADRADLREAFNVLARFATVSVPDFGAPRSGPVDPPESDPIDPAPTTIPHGETIRTADLTGGPTSLPVLPLERRRLPLAIAAVLLGAIAVGIWLGRSESDGAGNTKSTASASSPESHRGAAAGDSLPTTTEPPPPIDTPGSEPAASAGLAASVGSAEARATDLAVRRAHRPRGAASGPPPPTAPPPHNEPTGRRRGGLGQQPPV
jgi:serine/threonine-protein kinase